MTGEQMLRHVTSILTERRAAYGDATTFMAAISRIGWRSPIPAMPTRSATSRCWTIS
jgi:hypothetical protein